jgi:hypothetical protein
LTYIEYLRIETKEGFKTTEALGQLYLFQNIRLNNSALGSSSAINQDRGAGAAARAVLLSGSMPIISPENQMIKKTQEQRKRTHKAIDQIKVSSDNIAW